MTVSMRFLLVATTVCAATAWGQANKKAPQIGYLYPAGGRQGSVFQITAGGQFLRGAKQAYVSGEGVRAKVIKYYRPVRNIQKEQREEIVGRLKEVRDKRLAELREKDNEITPLGKKHDKKTAAKRKAKKAKVKVKSKAKPEATKQKTTAGNKNAKKTKGAAKTAGFKPVEHPLLHDLENKSLRELRHIEYHLFFPRNKRQQNTQIGEMVLVEITIDPDAEPGDRELRLETPAGLTNPMVFQVGQFPEIGELEPNDPKAFVNPNLPTVTPIDLPVLLNGQIMPGDVDRFRFRAMKGQQLVMEVHARRLIPYLADTVPGWFQPTLALYDAGGNEVAFADDYRFSPDPVLFYKIPEDGEYELEIRDAIYRGREDFIYRIAVGEQPFMTQMFPLGGRLGVATIARITGWNLPRNRLRLDTRPGPDFIRQTTLHHAKQFSNCVTYAVDPLPQSRETEPNNTTKKAQYIVLPRIVNGRIAQPGDVDVFRFTGRAGDQVVAEVMARRLYSPLDSLLRLTNASGRVLEWNDDREDQETGLLTHHADAYLRTRLPVDGVYFLHLSDAQHHGGEAYVYRLRMGRPRPDFALRMTPSSINVPSGRAALISVRALRKDGFDGDIELVLKDPPDGFTLSGGWIPPGRNRIRMTLTAPLKPPDRPVVLRLEGRARIGGKTVSRPVVPSEDRTQAFLYRHIVPSQELMVAVTGARRGGLPVELADTNPVRIPEGGTAQVRIKAPKHPKLRSIQLQLSEPPDGVTLQGVTIVPGGLTFVLKADGDAVQVGFADNLIIEAFAEVPSRRQNKKATNAKTRVSLGLLPAIACEIVQR